MTGEYSPPEGDIPWYARVYLNSVLYFAEVISDFFDALGYDPSNDTTLKEELYRLIDGDERKDEF